MTTRAVWRSRIVGYDHVDPRQLTANSRNWRTHPDAQRGEISPAYCDVIVRRWERVSGRQAVQTHP